jgi:hypothetical protein
MATQASHQYEGHPHEQYAGGDGAEGQDSPFDAQQRSVVKRIFAVAVLLWQMIYYSDASTYGLVHSGYMYTIVISYCVFYLVEFGLNLTKNGIWSDTSVVRKSYTAFSMLLWIISLFLFTNIGSNIATFSNGFVATWAIVLVHSHDFIVAFELQNVLIPSEDLKTTALHVNFVLSLISVMVSFDPDIKYIYTGSKKSYLYSIGPIAMLLAIVCKARLIPEGLARKILNAVLVIWWTVAVLVLTSDIPTMNIWFVLWLGWITSLVYADTANPIEVMAQFGKNSGYAHSGVPQQGGFGSSNQGGLFNTESGGYQNSGLPSSYDPVVPQGLYDAEAAPVSYSTPVE